MIGSMDESIIHTNNDNMIGSMDESIIYTNMIGSMDEYIIHTNNDKKTRLAAWTRLSTYEQRQHDWQHGRVYHTYEQRQEDMIGSMDESIIHTNNDKKT